MKLNELETAIVTLIERFVQRQAIVLSAMRELRPDIVMRSEGHPDGKEIARLTQINARKSGSGRWGSENQWEYFLHGGGCRLTHTSTGERIEWDVGNLNRFDRSWFSNYLHWLLTQDYADKSILTLSKHLRDPKMMERDELRRFIFPLLENLSTKGVLSELGSHNRYTLIQKS